MTKVVNENEGMAYEEHLWMVQANLSGLHKPRKMSYRNGFYSDRSGNYCDEDGDDKVEDGLVRWFFINEFKAKHFYDRINQYRNLLMSKM